MIPATVTYTFESDEKNAQDWGIYLMLPSATKLSICAGCQVFIQGCGGMGDENCTINRKLLGNIPIEEYTFKKEPQKVAGYLVDRQGDPVFHITTKNNRFLSQADQTLLIQILSRVKRYSSDGLSSLF